MNPFYARYSFPRDQDGVPVISGGGEGYPISEGEVVLVLGQICKSQVEGQILVATLLKTPTEYRATRFFPNIPRSRLQKLNAQETKEFLG